MNINDHKQKAKVDQAKLYSSINKIIRRLRKFKLSYKVYEEILESQAGLCAICRHINKNGKPLSIDHNHNTGFIRGLLCNNCNLAIGLFGDDVKTLIRAVEYLHKAIDNEITKSFERKD